jgi:hypothetical protein
VAADHVVVTEVVDLPRGDWRGGDLDLYVAFGAPGTPQAFDAHLVPVGDGSLEPDDADEGTKLVADRAARRPRTAHELIGPEEMAGMVVHVPDGALRRALAPGGMAALRLRTLLGLPVADASGGREVLVRLGNAQSAPLTLGRVQVASTVGSPPSPRAEARLCGKDADPWPLAVEVLPQATPRSSARAPAPIAPVLAVRHPTDALCVRFWSGGN